ncbi:hypothetical protein ACSTS3_08265 [Aquimarina muelleri]|uniref:hypothetical protein n=1 Tax=Aquimarina muelleri TaxID=279356 RepID=UPI003F686905
MSKLIFTKDRTENSIGFIGGGINKISRNIWPKIPLTETYQTHLCTLFPNFFRNGSLPANRNISIFISIEEHALGGVKESISSKYTINQKDDLKLLSEGYSQVIIYDINDNKEDLNLSTIVLDRKYFEISTNNESDMEKEHLFFEEHGMGMDISKLQSIPYFEQDIITPSPKHQFYLQLLEEDIETKFRIFQRGIGYFYLDRNIKKLNSGDNAGLFFIQNT